ncbi:MAG: hypothetical protein FVQ85_08160 [Planctomycetes bacterium]|nr:hypothetical protein [Planctomycetota bacterium]
MSNLSSGNHENPSESGEDTGVTKKQIAEAIEAYVEKRTATQGGYYVVKDDITTKELKLSLEKVHRERLSKVGQEMYFACADFKTPEGTVYDLDVFMKGTNKDDDLAQQLINGIRALLSTETII